MDDVLVMRRGCWPDKKISENVYNATTRYYLSGAGRKQAPEDAVELNAYQKRARQTDQGRRTAISLYGLVGEVGSILSTFKKRFAQRGHYPGFRAELIEELGDTLWYLASIATASDLRADP
ncbi:MAG TPA: nucleoside triphosphate pyrophosphohydrolase family protein [Stellaceae bacterium]|nr:nucleoside triphosphate pyrophosphohydrolase family protein [Stellaceae bacterium]